MYRLEYLVDLQYYFDMPVKTKKEQKALLVVDNRTVKFYFSVRQQNDSVISYFRRTKFRIGAL